MSIDDNAPDPVDIHVGKRLRLRRTIEGLSQDAIGKAIGVTFQQVQKYERGINRMGSSRLYQFAKVLGVPVSYFFEGFGDTGAGTYAMPGSGAEQGASYGFAATRANTFEAESFLNRETIELVRCFNRITDQQMRRRVLDLIKSMAGQEAEDDTAEKSSKSESSSHKKKASKLPA